MSLLGPSLQLCRKHKVGILYCKAGQSSEEEMYNNEEAGPAFEEFLSLIGEKVCLKGFTKYAAQLDVKSKWRGGVTSWGSQRDPGVPPPHAHPRGRGRKAWGYLGEDMGRWELFDSPADGAERATTWKTVRHVLVEFKDPPTL